MDSHVAQPAIHAERMIVYGSDLFVRMRLESICILGQVVDLQQHVAGVTWHAECDRRGAPLGPL